jgi:hypothetical protein
MLTLALRLAITCQLALFFWGIYEDDFPDRPNMKATGWRRVFRRAFLSGRLKLPFLKNINKIRFAPLKSLKVSESILRIKMKHFFFQSV